MQLAEICKIEVMDRTLEVDDLVNDWTDPDTAFERLFQSQMYTGAPTLPLSSAIKEGENIEIWKEQNNESDVQSQGEFERSRATK